MHQNRPIIFAVFTLRIEPTCILLKFEHLVDTQVDLELEAKNCQCHTM